MGPDVLERVEKEQGHQRVRTLFNSRLLNLGGQNPLQSRSTKSRSRPSPYKKRVCNCLTDFTSLKGTVVIL